MRTTLLFVTAGLIVAATGLTLYAAIAPSPNESGPLNEPETDQNANERNRAFLGGSGGTSTTGSNAGNNETGSPKSQGIVQNQSGKPILTIDISPRPTSTSDTSPQPSPKLSATLCPETTVVNSVPVLGTSSSTDTPCEEAEYLLIGTGSVVDMDRNATQSPAGYETVAAELNRQIKKYGERTRIFFTGNIAAKTFQYLEPGCLTNRAV